MLISEHRDRPAWSGTLRTLGVECFLFISSIDQSILGNMREWGDGSRVPLGIRDCYPGIPTDIPDDNGISSNRIVVA
jgi:hypothetical protein